MTRERARRRLLGGGVALLGALGISSWPGRLRLPILLDPKSVPPPPGDRPTTTTAVVEIGFGDVPLTFDHAVRVFLPGRSGNQVGLVRNGVFTPIERGCAGDTQSDADALPPDGDCKLDTLEGLVVWTKHFTRFVTYTNGCTPRPAPSIQSVPGGGKLRVTVAAQGGIGLASNRLIEVRIGQASNAVIEVEGQPARPGGNFTLTVPPNTGQVSFTVGRQSIGKATQVPLVIVDECGAWPTFVGGGPAAF